MNQLRIGVGLFFGTHAKEKGPIVVDAIGVQYRVRNAADMEKLGCGGANQDGRAVVFATGFDGEKDRENVVDPECWLVSIDHIDFKPGCRPLSKTDLHVREYAITKHGCRELMLAYDPAAVPPGLFPEEMSAVKTTGMWSFQDEDDRIILHADNRRTAAMMVEAMLNQNLLAEPEDKWPISPVPANVLDFQEKAT